MRPLIIEAHTFTALRKYAEDHPIFVTDEAVAKREVPIAGDDPNYTLEVPFGYRICFSMERQQIINQPELLVRHLSVSVDTPGRLPSIPAVEMIMKELGFEGGIYDQDSVFLEGEKAINVVQIIKPIMNERTI